MERKELHKKLLGFPDCIKYFEKMLEEAFLKIKADVEGKRRMANKEWFVNGQRSRKILALLQKGIPILQGYIDEPTNYIQSADCNLEPEQIMETVKFLQEANDILLVPRLAEVAIKKLLNGTSWSDTKRAADFAESAGMINRSRGLYLEAAEEVMQGISLNSQDDLAQIFDGEGVDYFLDLKRIIVDRNISDIDVQKFLESVLSGYVKASSKDFEFNFEIGMLCKELSSINTATPYFLKALEIAERNGYYQLAKRIVKEAGFSEDRKEIYDILGKIALECKDHR